MTVAMYTSICLVFFIQLTFVSAEKGTCPEGYYGEKCHLECSQTCRPLETYPCNKETGKCAEGCKSGYFGKTCERKCNCSQTCIQETGACIENPTTRPSDQSNEKSEKEKNSEERKTDVWMIVAIILIVVIVVLVVAFIGFILRIRSSSRSTESSGEIISMTLKQPLMSGSGSRPTEKQLKEKILDYEKQVQTLKDKVANLTDEHNRMVKVFGFCENSSYYLLKSPFDKSPWLQCPLLQFDGDKANIKAVNIDSYGMMSNKPDASCEDEINSSRFINYKGTTSTNPVIKTGFTQYWEIQSNIALNEPISKDTIILEVGFCSKKDEAHNEITLFKNGLRVAYCLKHCKICFMVLEDGKSEKHRETKIENKNGSTAYIIVGIMLDKDMKKLTFFDVNELHLIKTISIKCDNELWPMFGLGSKIETASSNMSLSCGSDIDITEEKLVMIKRAL